MYGKFFASTFTGSMLGAGTAVFAVWGYVIANSVDSQVELNPTLLAAMLGSTVPDVESAIRYLETPDPKSRTPDEEGRRLIREGQFAYRVVNHEHYRSLRDENDRRDYMREYMRKRRSEAVNVNGKPGKPPLAHTEAEAEEGKDLPKKPRKEELCDAVFERCWELVPRKEGKRAARKHFDAFIHEIERRHGKMSDFRAFAENLERAIRNYCRKIEIERPDVLSIKHGSTLIYNYEEYVNWEPMRRPKEARRPEGPSGVVL